MMTTKTQCFPAQGHGPNSTTRIQDPAQRRQQKTRWFNQKKPLKPPACTLFCSALQGHQRPPVTNSGDPVLEGPKLSLVPPPPPRGARHAAFPRKVTQRTVSPGAHRTWSRVRADPRCGRVAGPAHPPRQVGPPSCACADFRAARTRKSCGGAACSREETTKHARHLRGYALLPSAARARTRTHSRAHTHSHARSLPPLGSGRTPPRPQRSPRTPPSLNIRSREEREGGSVPQPRPSPAQTWQLPPPGSLLPRVAPAGAARAPGLHADPGVALAARLAFPHLPSPPAAGACA